ncbi:hypothetical protein [Paraburkholderia sp. BCC1885]|uniref:hypothetical protein n=1 Tax=Paraburkholderia sp. BCC1885 TaxID=2562669 RepID=UPI0011832009|nr:hypothetical protein [Paraburkholderia sp. BCC1885]
MNDPYAYKEINPLWSLVDPVSVEDAAALIAGFDPHSIDESRQFFRNPETNLTDSDGITWVHTAQTALENAVMAKLLKATIRRSAWERGWDEEPGDGEAYAQKVRVRDDDAAEAWDVAEPHAIRARTLIYRVSPNWALTTVAIADVRDWLASRGVTTGFFFPGATDAPDSTPNTHATRRSSPQPSMRGWQSRRPAARA